ncbi:hypothetical protein, conserved [Eimeria necatrix]|uniref:SET domain-containing protein n=1 Tax=Eimeria necatrix TaxID=51315 RepID=U6MTF0_9EIME|nr:hypothetical protein, conserved [Eimeria necatrix]CDJ67477.1 hypothetical protein, conserved [Eimeria necatrix]
MYPSVPSPEASVELINAYCNERHEGKLVCSIEPVKGRTLRATRSFKVGELILEEPPLHAVRLDPENSACKKLTELCEKRSFTHPAIWYWCALNSVLVEGDPSVDGLQTITRRQWDLLRILFIPEAVQPSSEAIALVDYMGLRGIVKDIDMEIMIQVWLHNCFEHHQSPEGYAIYFMPSFCSHSCIANALWCTDNDSNFRFFPRAEIRAGDEVTLTYLSEDDMLRNTSYRRQLLEGAKDFKCMCERCVAPVDFSRGFRCPSCLVGVIYVHADETGCEKDFGGALLELQEEDKPMLEEAESTSAAETTSDSPIPDERGADTWRQSLAPQKLHSEARSGPSKLLPENQGQEGSCSITPYTIWARLLTELPEDKLCVRVESSTSELACAISGSAVHQSNFKQSLSSVVSSETPALSKVISGLRFGKTSALVSPEAVSQVLQIPRSGCCCVCHFTWTDKQRQRALAVEKILEDLVVSLDEMESNESREQSPTNSLSSESGELEYAQRQSAEESEDTDDRAHQILHRIKKRTLLQMLRKKWHLLEKSERLVVNSIIRLTFKTHWLAAQWYRFLESVSSPRRKLPQLDRLIWQFRNLYPGLTPALAWAIWDVAQALLSIGESSKVKKSANFRRLADYCIISSYNESVFILSILFGPDGTFPSSIVNNYAAAVEECIQRIAGEKGPSALSASDSGTSDSNFVALPQDICLPKMLPWYISPCAEVAVVTSVGVTVVPGSVLIKAYGKTS